LREIEQLTLWELNDLMGYWKDHPPVHMLVAAYLLGNSKVSSRGKKPDDAFGRGYNTRKDSFQEFTHQVTLAGGTIHNHLPAAYRNHANL
jgi:hypothetical protein